MTIYSKITVLTEQGKIRIGQLERRNAIYKQLKDRCLQCPQEFADFMIAMDNMHLEQSRNMYNRGFWHCISSVSDVLSETDLLLDRLETLAKHDNVCLNINKINFNIKN